MRTFSFFDAELYCEFEDLDEDLGSGYDIGKLIENGVYRQREYDFVIAEFGILAEFAGISIKSGLGYALKNLEKNYLIEPMGSFSGYDTWKIFRIPPQYFLPSRLNDSVRKRYGNRETVNSNL